MIDLSAFCSADTCRVALLKPFRRGDFTYASDGRILVRVPASLYPSEVVEKAPSESSLNNLGSWNHDSLVDWSPVPDLPQREVSPCSRCDGTGKRKKCHVCDGEGVRECDLGYEHECRECRGYGVVKGGSEDGVECDNCDGAGTVPKTVAVTIGERLLNAEYLRQIREVPGAQICPVGSWDTPMPFKFDDGLGYLMPMRKESA